MTEFACRAGNGSASRSRAPCCASPKLLVLDEPTNHLDIHAVTHLMENLRKLESQLALVLVSHDRDVVRYADDVYEIENGFATRLAKSDDAIKPGALAV